MDKKGKIIKNNEWLRISVIALFLIDRTLEFNKLIFCLLQSFNPPRIKYVNMKDVVGLTPTQAIDKIESGNLSNERQEKIEDYFDMTMDDLLKVVEPCGYSLNNCPYRKESQNEYKNRGESIDLVTLFKII